MSLGLSFSIQRITPQTVEVFKAVRLRALEDAPSAFGSTYARESTFSDSEWSARVERWNGDTGVGFLATDLGEPCGIAGSLLDQADGSRAELVSVWTAPTHRGRGIGGLLVEAVISWAHSRDVHDLYLMVTQTNDAAIRLYQKLGFRLTGRTEPYPNDSAIKEYEMKLTIDR
jgi:ribosomal protein S18 acetylase RimI-like enzyme